MAAEVYEIAVALAELGYSPAEHGARATAIRDLHRRAIHAEAALEAMEDYLGSIEGQARTLRRDLAEANQRNAKLRDLAEARRMVLEAVQCTQ